ncbi:MAG TPA: peptidylprolyl isomerase [Verrucomicrobiae bacterium]|nr:peptidylprolyl isomerase [Verrucomicrobiae bacterium]
MKRMLLLTVLAVGMLNVHAASPAPLSLSNAPAMKPDDLFTNMIVAKGTGFTITRAQLDNEMVYARSSATAHGQNLGPEQMGMIEKQLLQQLIFLKALNVRATDADKAAGAAKAGKQYQEMLDAVSTNSVLAAQLDTRLKSVGLTRDELFKQWKERAIADAVVRRELKINITDDDAMAYYTNNPAKFEAPETVHAAHILLMTKDTESGQDLPEAKKAEKLKQIQDLLKRARSGENFSNLVAQYSEDPGSKTHGGEYTFPRGQMVPEFEAAAFSLQTNQISDVVTTVYGYHIIKMLGKNPATKIELSKVSDDLKEMLAQQAIMKLLPDYMKQLEKEENVEIVQTDLKMPDTDPDATGGPASAMPK